MIEKLKEHDIIDPKTDKIIGTIGCDLREIMDKLNEVIDAANELINCVSQLGVEFTDEIHAENMPQPIKLYVCPDGSVYDNEDVAKSHAASMFNPLPAGATTTDRVYLEKKLDLTREALDKGMEHFTGLNNMIESWYKLLQSDEEDSTKYAILKSAISAYVENKGGDNE